KAMPLGIFSPPDAGSGKNEDVPPACSMLRKLRTDRTMLERDRSKVINDLNTGFFAPQNVMAYASRIGWEARPDDYSAITLDGRPIYQTGSYQTGPATAWPCYTKGNPAAENPGLAWAEAGVT